MIRVEKIAELLKNKYTTLIDIGSDHAYLGLNLLKKNLVEFVWNVEINQSPLERSKKTYIDTEYLNRVKFYLSDGFSSLPKIPENSLVVIAGVGSKTILNILNRKLPTNLCSLILIPHTHPILIREWANKNGLDIYKESYFVEKGIIYILIYLQKTHRSIVLSKDLIKKDIYFGKPQFLKENKDLAFKYWKIIKDKIIDRQEKYWLIWEKEFISQWDKFIKELD